MRSFTLWVVMCVLASYTLSPLLCAVQEAKGTELTLHELESLRQATNNYYQAHFSARHRDAAGVLYNRFNIPFMNGENALDDWGFHVATARAECLIFRNASPKSYRILSRVPVYDEEERRHLIMAVLWRMQDSGFRTEALNYDPYDAEEIVQPLSAQEAVKAYQYDEEEHQELWKRANTKKIFFYKVQLPFEKQARLIILRSILRLVPPLTGSYPRDLYNFHSIMLRDLRPTLSFVPNLAASEIFSDLPEKHLPPLEERTWLQFLARLFTLSCCR